MRRTLRRLACAAGCAALAVGIAEPAGADYSAQPITLPWHPAGPVHAVVAGSGVVYLGGMLDGTGGIAAVDASTGDLLWTVAADDDVRALALSADGATLYAGGRFNTVSGTTHRHLVALRTADHTPVPTWKGSAAGAVRDLVVHGSDLYVAGRITHVDGAAQRGIGAVDATSGRLDPAFGIDADDDVLGLALDGDQLIVSGAFTHLGGQPRSLLASIDLTADTVTGWTPPRLCSSCAQYWDVQTDGTNAYVATSGNAGGAFSLATGQQTWPLVRGTGDFQAVWLPGDGHVYYGGHFGLGVWSGAQPQNVVDAKMLVAVSTADGGIDAGWTPRLYSSYPGVWAFTSTAGKLWVGGDFTGQQVGGSNNHLPFLAAYPSAGTVVDTEAPTGSYHVDRTTAWAGFTRVSIDQQAIHDDVTPDAKIARAVAWGDGSTTDWSSGATVSHVYPKAGSYTPSVTLTDEAGNSSSPLPTSTVEVTADSSAPVLTLHLPRHRHSVDAWSVLRGRATDSGTGIAEVWVKAAEKRGSVWYGYDAPAHRWVAAADKAAALASSRRRVAQVTADHRWSAGLSHLRRGTLVVHVRAADQVDNLSTRTPHRVRLLHR
jgi:hypothetical protein